MSPRLRNPDLHGVDPARASTADHNVFGLHFREAESSLVLVPVGWDATTSYRRGTALGPEAIHKASAQLDLHDRELGPYGVPAPWRHGIHLAAPHHDIASWNETASGLAAPIIEHGGDVDAEPELRRDLAHVNMLSAKLNQAVYDETRHRLDRDQIVGVVGGEHSVSFGAIRAHAERFPGLGILHVDAHADLRFAFEGFTHSHASILRNVLDSIPGVTQVVQVGIRDFCEEELQLIEKDPRLITFFDADLQARRFAGETWRALVDEIVSKLPAKVYVTFDIDGLDPALCPATGTPVPGGLAFAEAQYLLLALVRAHKHVVGFDLTEVAPPPSGHDEFDGNVGARILYRLCGVALASEFALGP